MKRTCSRATCSKPAVATLTFVFADSMAVLGPLAAQAEPGCYDLCIDHAKSTTVPLGWQLVKVGDEDFSQPAPDEDDLLALANAVREIGFSDADESDETPSGDVVEIARRGHLRVITDVGHRSGKVFR